MSIAEIMKPPSLDYYRDLVPDDYNHARVSLTIDEAAAVLKAYDYGVSALAPSESGHLDEVIAKLKEEVWP